MKRFFILTALMAVLGLSSCEKEPSKAIIGTWEAETIELIANGITTSANLEEKDAIMRFTFNADGTGSAYIKFDEEGETTAFKYAVVGDILSITIDSDTHNISLTFEKDTMIAELGEEVFGQENTSLKIYFKKA